MPIGKINYMYVITDTGAIVSLVVIAKYAETFAFADGNLCDIRYEIVWNSFGSSPISPLLCAPIGLK